MNYAAIVCFPGCLPEGDGDLSVFETAAEAWRDHLTTLGDDRWVLDDEDDPDGPQSMTNVALAMERAETDGLVGTIGSLTVNYEVIEVEDYSEVPC